MISENDLRAAAETVGQMPRAELQRNLARLKEAQKARSQHEVLRQQAELDSLELDQSAYDVATQADKHGDVQTAAQWYRVAAMNDFADAQFKLAEVLHALADKYLQCHLVKRGGS
jgi:TPR repeat protein